MMFLRIAVIALLGSLAAFAQTPSREQLKQEAQEVVGTRQKLVQEITDMLFSLSELGYQEVESANYLTGQPDDYGWFRSANLTPNDGSPLETWQELTFRESDDGIVNAVAVMQATGY